MPGEGGERVARGYIPQPDGIVPTPTGESAPIRTEDNTRDTTRMPGEGGERVARGHIPQADSFVLTAASEGGAIRTEDDASDFTRMPGEQCHFVVGGGIVEPNPDVTRNRKQGTIGRIRHIVDAAFAEA